MPDTKIFNLFPEPVATYSIGREFTVSEIRILKSQKWHMPHGNIQASESSSDTYVLNTKGLEGIRDFIRRSITDFGKTVYDFQERKTELYITQSWMNRTMPGQYHHDHKHPNSIVSGTLYIDVNENDEIKFNKPGEANSAWLFEPNKWNMWNSEVWGLPVVNGQLLLWRSFLPHAVPPTPGPNVRYSLSFNTFVRGSIGREENYYGLTLK